VEQYRQHLEQQERLAQQNIAELQRQKRMAQYRFQEQYLERLRQQRNHLRDDRFDYDRDPYFYTPAIYRYNRGGRYYQTNEYGAKMLRQAVNHGYEEGFRAGKADRDDRWRGNYKDSYAYRDANYGYSGYYVDRSDYNHYFREGFRRGYEDGYNSRYRYGRHSNGNYSMLDNILSQILNFQALR
jgi:flagellar biosynthesis/type III secretory pathway protein FliH